MKDISDTLKIGDKEYKLLFNFNVLQAVQEEYGTLTKWVEEGYGKETGEPSAKALIFIMTLMINEGVDLHNEENPDDKLEPVTEKQVGRLLSEIGLSNAVTTIDELMSKSTEPGESSKNE
jgi:hypothetical protein